MPDILTATDGRFLAAAVRTGSGALGEAWPNPAVGAILVKDECVISSARTGRGGRPHAEHRALTEAGDRARNATLYVSLEPCAHLGKTPPCTDAIIAAGVARVVVGMTDPDARVSGRGAAALREAGIAVDVLPGELARKAHAGHVTRTELGRPWVTLKLAMSADGMIGRKGEGHVPITAERASRHVHALRSRHDGVLVGRGTVATDDPQLTCRLPGLDKRSPVRIVLDSGATLDRNARMFARTGRVRVFHVVSDGASSGEPVSDHIDRVPVAGSADGLDLASVLHLLADRGLTRILVEGGARIAASLLKDNLVDELILFRSPMEIGERGVAAFAGIPTNFAETSGRFDRVERRLFGPDLMVRYIKA